MMSAKYLEYYAIILRGPFFRGHTVHPGLHCPSTCTRHNLLPDVNFFAYKAGSRVRTDPEKVWKIMEFKVEIFRP